MYANDNSGHADTGTSSSSQPRTVRPAASFIATKLIEESLKSKTSLAYVALSENAANDIAISMRCLAADIEVIVLPPWDCLPYDRVPPSKQCMGRRMDALRVWSQPLSGIRLLVTSLDAVLQRIPPSAAITASQFEISVGAAFERGAFEAFARSTGYLQEGLVDEPGEFTFRDDVIDIFPAGALAPMRIVLSEDGRVQELRSYNPETQRTMSTVETMVFGPASEAVLPPDDDGAALSEQVPRRLFQLFDDMQTVFDVLDGVKMVLAEGTEERLDTYLEIIEEARQAHHGSEPQGADAGQSLYLNRAEITKAFDRTSPITLDLSGGLPLPDFAKTDNPSKAFSDFVQQQIQSERTTVIAGEGGLLDRLIRRVKRIGLTPASAASWSDIKSAASGSCLELRGGLERGFADMAAGIVVIAVGDVLGEAAGASDAALLLAEPELRLGDVVVHEDHGVGILKTLEQVDVDGIGRDAARLEYRDGASILVPMEEFNRLWRYGSEAEAVTLDRLHTDNWAKKRQLITKDIQETARHLLRIAKQRREAIAESYVPPVTEYRKFTARFPYAETADQAAAVEAVFADLASGKVMNRLICGDVGFGKTEVALRAAAAVALSGGQVVLVCPTTVLARQHFLTFERRFASTCVKVAMLSRVVSAGDAKRIKADLAAGDIGIVVATQAILSKDVAFSRLGLLIVDEEHRFGKRDKTAMTRLAPQLHTLAMSATPIPNTMQAAMIGVQDVSILATPPSKRRPVRTSLSVFDRASMRVALMRERRRGGQSFIVAPQIEDLGQLETLLSEIVPELSVRVAHGKMPAAEMDEVMVRFADGDGDILLATNIIESGLDVPRANTLFIWRADRFGLAQLHQLRGRVGRGKAQGIAYLLTTAGDDISEETRLRLSAMVEHDRLGSGLAISMQDLDQRGGGDMMGEDQAGHMKVIGISLYQKLLERAVIGAAKRSLDPGKPCVVNIGFAGAIPADYVPDAAVRLNLNARLLRATTLSEIEAFAAEFEDRFGEMPDEVAILLRIARLKITAGLLGIDKLDAGPRGLAVSFISKPGDRIVRKLSKHYPAIRREDRLIYEQAIERAIDRVDFLEKLMA